MSGLLDWGIGIILWLQSHFSPALDGVFKAITFLGEEDFYLLFMAFLYWCVDRYLGARATLLLLFSNYTNTLAKEVLHQPRPFTYDARVRMIKEVGGYGLPSGHAQNTLAIWGFLMRAWRAPLFWAFSLLLILAVGLSRIYLGVHFPTDVLGGYLLGGLVLWAYLWLEARIGPILARWSTGLQVTMTVFVSIFLALSLGTEDGMVVTGALMGLLVGMIIERHALHYSAEGSAVQRLLRFWLGFAVMMGLRFGLKAAFAGLEPMLVWRFIRYALVGLWAAAGAPWTFLRLGWAQRER